MSNDMLSNIVAILISNQHRGTTMQLLKHRCLISIRAVFKHALDDTATIWMAGQCLDLALECLEDESNVLHWDSFDSLLDDVVTILVLDTLKDIWLKLLDKLSLLISQDMFESLCILITYKVGTRHKDMYLLHDTTPIHLT